MVSVLVDLARLTGTADNGAARGGLEVRYSKRRYPDAPNSQIVVKWAFPVKLDENGRATVIVPPSEPDGFYTWTERLVPGGGITRHTSVPDVETVNYRDLVDVDPATFLPTAAPAAAWWAMANGTVVSGEVIGDDLILTQFDGSLINAGNVRGPQGNEGPANQLAIGAITTLAAGESATAEIAGVYPNQVLNLGIPEGDPGPAGATLLSALTDVDLTDLADGDAMVWDATAGKWVRVPLSSTYVAPTGTDDRLQVAGVDVEPEQVGAAPALGSDDNYVTDAEKLALHTHPAVIAQGATQADARAAIGAGTSNVVIGTGSGEALDASTAPELIRNTMGSALVAGANVTITPNDGADTITIAATGGGGTTTALYLPATAGNYVSTPSAAALNVAGDLDVRVKVTLADWGPSDSTLAAKLLAESRSWWLIIRSTGKLYLQYSADGSTYAGQVTSTEAVPFADGSAGWVRFTLDVDNGAGGATTTFYTSTDGTTWTQLGAPVVVATAITLFASTAAVEIGTWNSGGSANHASGLLHNFEMRSGIGGAIVASWRGDTPAVRYRDPAGNIWTVTGTANAWTVV